jgi:Ion transport protein
LQDYEANRPPTFGGAASLGDISDYQMAMYHWKYSTLAEVGRVSAALAFFASSYMEGFLVGLESGQRYYYHRYTLTALNLFAITVFLVDIWMRHELRRSPSKQPGSSQGYQRSASIVALLQKHQVRISRSEKLIQPLILFCVLLGLENVARLLLVSGDIVLFSSIFKPFVLFYVSSQARDALAAVRRIIKIVLRVLVMELLLILMFAAVACRLFQKYESFSSLGIAWLSLFELATTVVNPSIWMPVYRDSKVSALFFIFFIVTAVFYLHSLVLSVVFQTYIQAAAEIHERNASDREDAVYLAFKALLNEEQPGNSEGRDENLVDVRAVRATLRLLRPHYSAMKVNALVEIVDPSGQGTIDYASFRTKIRQALNASIRTARNASNLAMSVELIAVAVAIVNFIYVILLSSEFVEDWFVAIQVEAGCCITLVAAFELLIRFNPLRIPDFTPLTRLNAIFDGSALVAALISCIGIGMYLAGHPFALNCILIGRAIDIIRTMRFFQIFRDVIRRTSDVVPALNGPLVLVVTTLHAFVYVGMALWGGAIEVGLHKGEITELYDLNNFNSYQEGTVTMFQILAVNDWYAIAEVFLHATQNASVYIVYPFFIVANLICVSIMLNVLTAFFVESFVTKLHDDKDAPAEATATMHKERDFSIKTSEGNVRRVASGSNMMESDAQITKFDRGTDADSEVRV